MSDPQAPKADLDSMLEQMRPQLEADEASGKMNTTSVDRLRKAISHPQAQPVIDELMAREADVVKEGEPAPDFSLPWLLGQPDSSAEGAEGEKMTLSDHFGKRPVALIFGSYT